MRLSPFKWVPWWQRKVYVPSEPKGLTWLCHVCKEERPDVMIGVFKHERDMGAGVTMTENVRYCLDRPECLIGASKYHHIKEPT